MGAGEDFDKSQWLITIFRMSSLIHSQKISIHYFDTFYYFNYFS